MYLQKFYATNDVVLSEMEAWEILVWFFGGNAHTSPAALTYNDRSFAQSLMFEAIRASKEVGRVKKLFVGTSNPAQRVSKTLKVVATYMATNLLWARIEPSDLEDPEIVDFVKDEITRKWKSLWAARIHNGGTIY